MRLVFAGTSEFARVILGRLLDAGLVPLAVYTRADKRAGRGMSMRASPVRQLVLDRLGADHPLLTPARFDDDAVARLSAFAPDVFLTAAYGILLPPAALTVSRWAPVNVHASVLPRWRGAAPVTYAIATRDANTGVCLTRMERQLDAGAVLAQKPTPIGLTETRDELTMRLASLGADLAIDFLSALAAMSSEQRRDALTGQEQDGSLVTYAPRLSTEQSAIDWAAGAADIEAWVRAMQPRPGMRTIIDGRTLIIHRAVVDECAEHEQGLAPGAICPNVKVLRIRCADGVLCPLRVQIAGRRALDIEDFVRGHSLKPWQGLACTRPGTPDSTASRP